MKVRFWGTRGSLAKPGPSTLRYGGNTSCIEVRSASGTVLVIDCGTGAHELGIQLLRERPQGMAGHLLISHTHWDHIQGIPFFAPLFTPGHRWDLYAPQGFGTSLRETLAGQMEYTYFPVTLDALAAEVHYHDLVEGELRIDDITIRTRYLNHPALTLAFRIEADGASMVYSCDHEPHDREQACARGPLTGEDLAHSEFLRGADLVIHDAQYTAAEYPKKVGWGHSTVEYAVHVCRDAGVKRLALTHHDPLRSDDDIDQILVGIHAEIAAHGGGIEVFGAAEGVVIELAGERDAAAAPRGPSAHAQSADGSAQASQLLLVGRSPALDVVAEAARDDELQLLRLDSVERALERLPGLLPDLVVVDAEGDLQRVARMAEALRQASSTSTQPTALIGIVASTPPEGAVPGVTDWLVAPFTREYARTRMRAWLLRAQCRWQRAAQPENEAARLAALHALAILDTPQEERFDRFTRLAAVALDMPVSLVSLVDRDRQWFKSCIGIEGLSETPRDVSFCAHAIHQRELFVVPDTLLDARFADNPAVVDGPRVRFYAGRPLWLSSGACVGTLCIADHRPRHLDEQERRVLDDLGRMVELELEHRVG